MDGGEPCSKYCGVKGHVGNFDVKDYWFDKTLATVAVCGW